MLYVKKIETYIKSNHENRLNRIVRKNSSVNQTVLETFKPLNH